MVNIQPLEEIPNSAYYIPNFISKDEEKFLLRKIYQVPKPKWTYLSNRKLQNWGGLPHPKGMVQENLPEWLESCCDSVNRLKPFSVNKPNHVLVNEYKPGQGIMPHQDGPLYYPSVSTVSLGCHTVLDFYKASPDHEARKYEFSFVLERRSLLIVKETLYTDYLHGIVETEHDEFDCLSIKNGSALGDESLRKKILGSDFMTMTRDDTRVSLTIRHVPKTIKFNFKT